MQKSLFQSTDIEAPVQPAVTKATVVQVQSPDVVTVIGKQNKTVQECFPEIVPGVDYHFSTAGLWSTHDLLFHLLGLVGPAHVTLATWSITEAPAALLMRGLHEGLILSLKALFDSRVRVRNPQTFEFIKFNLNQYCRISSCHAKVTVIENADWKISINGSPNYTNNPRIEAGIVSTNAVVADFHKDWILAEINKSHPFA